MIAKEAEVGNCDYPERAGQMFGLPLLESAAKQIPNFWSTELNDG
ncbi:MAG: hypothetical protein ACYDHY_18890 [Acidiferrobacterales bacterium]